MYEKPSLYKHWDFTLLDILMLEGCYLLSYYLRHGEMVPITASSYTVMLLWIIILTLISGVGFHNYEKILQRGYLKEFSYVIQHVTVVTAGLILYLFVTKDAGEFSRLVLGYFCILSIFLIYIERVLYKKFLRKKNTTGYNRRNAILITALDISAERIKKLKEDVSGVVELDSVALAGDEYKFPKNDIDNIQSTSDYCGLKRLCELKELPEKIRNQWVDEVFVLLSDRENRRYENVLRELATMGITIHMVLNTEDSYRTDRTIEKIGDTILLTESIHAITFGQVVAKRTLDIVGALIGLLVTGIFTIIIGPMIYKEDPGPIFYKQKRIGRNGRVFNMYKFRSMYQDADVRKKELMSKNEMNGLMFKMKNDPRILGSGPDGSKHGIGWFIRTTSIDEFPQFLNVLLGQLSLVGTRPPTVDEWNRYEPHHRARMAVKPGITGLWQVSGRNNIKDFEDVVKLDLEYISNFSISEDLKILFRTIKVVLKHEGAE